MSPELAHLLSTYGLGAVGVGAFLEGETVLLAAGALGARGLLDPLVTWGVASAGAWLGHAVWFGVGRRVGRERIIRLVPRARLRIERAAALVRARPWLSIILLQYMYGLRMVGAIALGLTDLPVRWFLAAQGMNCGIWAALVVGAGYAFGESARLLLGGSVRGIWLALAVILVLAVLRRSRSGVA